jgi:hypothetical protein
MEVSVNKGNSAICAQASVAARSPGLADLGGVVATGSVGRLFLARNARLL